MQNDTPIDMLQIKIERAREELPEETKRAIKTVDWRAVILSMREKKGYSFEQLEDLELETELLLCGLLNPADYPKELEMRMGIPRPQVDLLVNEMNEFVFKKIKDELIKNSERKEIFVKKESPDFIPKTQGVEKITKSNPNIIEVGKYVSSPNIINIKEPNTTNIPPATIKKEEAVLSENTNIETMPQELTSGPVEIPKITTEKVAYGDVLSKAGIEIIPNKPNIGKGNVDEKTIESVFAQKLSGSFQMPTSKTEYSLPMMGKNNTVPVDSKVKTSKADPYRIDPNE
jgi:hypothetical protein